MIPAHHPPDDLLFEYSAGVCTPAVALFAACHLTLCPECRRRVRGLDVLGEVLLDEIEPVSMQGGVELDDGPEPAVADGVLPQPLFDLIGPVEGLEWKQVLPGLERIDLPLRQEHLPARLYRFAPNLKIPYHRHNGVERTLVLTGGYTDRFGHHERGDASVLDGTIDHGPRMDDGDPCIALAVNDIPFDAKGWRGKLLQWWARA